MTKPKKFNEYPDFYPVDKESSIYKDQLQELLGSNYSKLIDYFPGGIIFNIYDYGNGYSMQVSYKDSDQNVNRILNIACFLTAIHWKIKYFFLI